MLNNFYPKRQNLEVNIPSNKSLVFWLFCLSCFAIIYGSLFPFEFEFNVTENKVNDFLHSWKSVSSLGDILGNIVLFLPFGFFGATLKNSTIRFNLKRVGFFWFLVAVGCQLVQLVTPSRDPSLFDLFGNAVGSILGWLLVIKTPLLSMLMNKTAKASLSPQLILAAIWLVSHLVPFVPSVDWQSYKNALKPLFLNSGWSLPSFFLETAAWIVFFQLLRGQFSYYFRLKYFLLAIIVFIFLKVVIVTNVVLFYELLALIVAGGLCLRPPSFLASNLPGWGLLLFVAVDALLPVSFRTVSAEFQWLPFSGLLEGSMLTNAEVLCRKVFLYGAIILSWVADKNRFVTKVSVAAISLMCIEACQKIIIGKTPEITDPILFILIALLAYKVREALNSEISEKFISKEKGEPISPESVMEINLNGRVKSFLGGERYRVLISIIAYSAFVVITLKALMGLPNIPYNVKEMFRFGGSGIDLLFFSLTALSLGWGTAWAGRRISGSTRLIIDVPLVFFQVTGLIYALLWLSVTRESIMDIAGSSVFVHRVTERAVMGEFGVELARLFGTENLSLISSFFEPIVRFGALVGPLLMTLGITFALFFTVKDDGLGVGAVIKRFFFLSLVALPWLYFCKVIAFDWSSTDNLNELIARDGSWGLGGGGYLYLLVLCISVLSVLLCSSMLHSAKKSIAIFIIIVLSVPICWLFFTLGLEGEIEKYGLNYSGVDFLLGPDRKIHLSKGALFFRWFLVQVSVILGLAFGALLYMRWINSPRNKPLSVLMVCRHNICRSPMAAGLLKYYLKEEGLGGLIKVDSAGTRGDMVGVRVDERAGKVALKFGIDLKRRKSRRIKPRDYLTFDYILAMDQANYQVLLEESPAECIEKIALVMSFSPEMDSLDVPDPYYGSVIGFEKVFTLLESAIAGVAKHMVINLSKDKCS